MDENGHHTLADFVEESMKHRVIIEGLPEGITILEAAAKFRKMSHINLEPLLPSEHYFSGWFPIEGTRVVTEAGDHLFTVFGTELIKLGGFRLRIEPAALKLLR